MSDRLVEREDPACEGLQSTREGDRRRVEITHVVV